MSQKEIKSQIFIEFCERIAALLDDSQRRQRLAVYAEFKQRMEAVHETVDHPR